MSRIAGRLAVAASDAERAGWLARVWLPVSIGAGAVTVVLLLIVRASRAAWFLLGAGRGLVPEEYYDLSGFVLVLATTFGQAAGWAGGSALIYYAMTLVGFGGTWTTARLAMSLVYVALGGLPLLVYHVFFGQWLLGLPRTGLDEWLAANHPDARWLLLVAHPFVDLSLVPLAAVFLGLLWMGDDAATRNPALHTGLALALLGTSLAVALSLAIHSTLVHIRL